MTEESFLWVFISIVFLLDLFFAAIKAAFTHVRLPSLLSLHEKDERRVERAIKTLERPRLRTTLRISVLTTHLFGGALLMLLLGNYLGNLPGAIWISLASVLAALFVIVFFEYLIEGSILKNIEAAAINLAPYARLLDFIYTPLSLLTTKLLGERASIVTLDTMTEDELRNWVEEGQPEGNLEKGEREMIYSIFQFAKTMAREVMVPRIDVMALDINTTIGEARKAFIEAGHSRVPVFEDTIDNVIGLLYAKDLIGSLDDKLTIASQRHMLRIAHFVPEVKKVDELLADMQSRGIHMSLVVDEYGGVAGVVTLEDIVEEIVGEIRDEYDQKEEQLYHLVAPHEYIFSGRISLDDFNDLMGVGIATDNADTLGGFIYGELGHVPTEGESITTGGVTFQVDDVIGRRILKVRARLDNVQESKGNEPNDKR